MTAYLWALKSSIILVIFVFIIDNKNSLSIFVMIEKSLKNAFFSAGFVA